MTSLDALDRRLLTLVRTRGHSPRRERIVATHSVLASTPAGRAESI
jgi:hypothetical protein